MVMVYVILDHLCFVYSSNRYLMFSFALCHSYYHILPTYGYIIRVLKQLKVVQAPLRIGKEWGVEGNERINLLVNLSLLFKLVPTRK